MSPTDHRSLVHQHLVTIGLDPAIPPAIPLGILHELMSDHRRGVILARHYAAGMHLGLGRSRYLAELLGSEHRAFSHATEAAVVALVHLTTTDQQEAMCPRPTT